MNCLTIQPTWEILTELLNRSAAIRTRQFLRFFYAPTQGQAIFNGGSREPNTKPFGNKFRRLNAVVEARHPTKVANTKLNVQETAMSNAIAPFALSSIRNQNGLFSLNDLHAAAGGEEKHKPANFLRNQQIIDLIELLKSEQSPSLISKQGLGTFVCKELVIAYAAWISPIFHLRVLRTFLDQHSPSIFISAEQILHLKQGVRERVYATGQHWQKIYHDLFDHVGAPSLREIKAQYFDMACRFLGISTTLRSISEQDLVPVDALPAPIEQKPAHIASVDFDLRENIDYAVYIRNGKLRRSVVIHVEKDFADRKQNWCMDRTA